MVCTTSMPSSVRWDIGGGDAEPVLTVCACVIERRTAAPDRRFIHPRLARADRPAQRQADGSRRFGERDGRAVLLLQRRVRDEDQPGPACGHLGPGAARVRSAPGADGSLRRMPKRTVPSRHIAGSSIWVAPPSAPWVKAGSCRRPCPGDKPRWPGRLDAEGAWDSTETLVTVQDTTPPALQCPAPTTAECAGPDGASVGVMATASDRLRRRDDHEQSRKQRRCFGYLPARPTPVNFTATDAVGNKATCATNVTVRDATPPSLILAVDRTNLWPPNHRLVPVHMTWQPADLCDRHRE